MLIPYHRPVRHSIRHHLSRHYCQTLFSLAWDIDGVYSMPNRALAETSDRWQADGPRATAIRWIPWDVGIPWDVKESLNTGTDPNKDVRGAASHASDLHKSRYEFLGCRKRVQLKSMEEAYSVAALAHALSANSTLQSPSLNFGYTTCSGHYRTKFDTPSWL